jgi:hypothetical protein
MAKHVQSWSKHQNPQRSRAPNDVQREPRKQIHHRRSRWRFHMYQDNQHSWPYVTFFVRSRTTHATGALVKHDLGRNANTSRNMYIFKAVLRIIPVQTYPQVVSSQFSNSTRGCRTDLRSRHLIGWSIPESRSAKQSRPDQHGPSLLLSNRKSIHGARYHLPF